MKLTAKDGTVFGAFNQGNGYYIAAEDESGTHYAPAQHSILPHWTEDERRAHLRDAVAEHDYSQSQKQAASERGDCPSCGQRGPLPQNHYYQGNCTGN